MTSHLPDGSGQTSDAGGASPNVAPAGAPLPSPALPTSVCAEAAAEGRRPGPEDVVEAGSSSHCGVGEAHPPGGEAGTVRLAGALGGAGAVFSAGTGGAGASAPAEDGLLGAEEFRDSADDLSEESALRVIEESKAWEPADLAKDSDLFPDEGEATRLDGVVTSGLPDGSESAITERRVVDEYEGAIVQVGSYTGPLVSKVNPNVKQPEKLTHRIKYVAHLAALGLTSREIAEKSGYTQATVNKLINAPIVSLEVERARQSFLRQDPDTSLRIMIPKALTAIHEVLDSPEEKRSLKVDTAFRLLERTHGKPKQSVDMGGNLLKDLFELLDQRDAEHGKQRVVETERVTEAEVVADPLDAAVESFCDAEKPVGDVKV